MLYATLYTTALLLLVAAAPVWRWDLPQGVVAPVVPADNGMSAAKVELGRRLFYDADLSADGTLACAGCHEQKRAFADGNATRPGVHGGAGRRNVPGLANVGWFARLTVADPAITTLEAQALVPLFGERPEEMGMKGRDAEFTRRLGADRCYRAMFARAFPERQGRIDTGSVTAALAAFERTMISYHSAYDRYQAGDRIALSPLAVEGARLFQARGCTSCHDGVNFGGMNYHQLEPAQPSDPGLIEQTGRPDDAGRFRTPSLRNVALTGPWWHDGRAATLEAAIRRHPVAVPVTDMPALLAFFDSLTDPDFIADPRLSRPDRACGKPL
nr:cytochrome c peroxidase [Sphingobium sp. BYY-5]